MCAAPTFRRRGDAARLASGSENKGNELPTSVDNLLCTANSGETHILPTGYSQGFAMTPSSQNASLGGRSCIALYCIQMEKVVQRFLRLCTEQQAS